MKQHGLTDDESERLYPVRQQSTGKHPKCPCCRQGGYTQRPSDGDGRPHFTCMRCGREWSNGKAGGVYALKAGREGGEA